MAASSKRMGNLSSTFVKSVSAYSISAPPVHGQNKATNIIKPMQTRIFRKKYVNGSENSKGTSKNKNKNQAQRLFWPRSIHLYNQKPNPACETVPLKKGLHDDDFEENVRRCFLLKQSLGRIWLSKNNYNRLHFFGGSCKFAAKI